MSETNPSLLIAFLLQLGVILAVGLFFGQLMRKINQPAVLGELIGGIVLGPTVFGFLFPAVYQWLFLPSVELTQSREAVIRLGMLFFMFVAGLEVNLSQLRQHQRSILLVSILGCLLPFALGLASVFLFPRVWLHSGAAADANFVLFIGIALSISALPVITRILMDLKLLHGQMGGLVITSAAINDLLGWALFALLLSSLSANGSGFQLPKILGLTFLFSVLVLLIGRRLGELLFKWARRSLVWPSGLLAISAIFIFVSAAIAEMMNIHAIFGAFLIGVALFPVFEHNGAGQVKEIIHQFAVSLFAPLYFVSVGLKANFAANFDLQLVLLVLALAIVGKVAGAGLGAWFSGANLKNALAIGFAMNARGAMEMILASVALEYGLIDQRIFVALVIMALVTSMMSGPMLQWLLKIPQLTAVKMGAKARGK
ncbi:MAG: Na(+)/H(+)-K(+) antiporter GerN [Anaerolineae bacterium]|nr:Na(+)/H(+)-K(+) antiporter GerN [Anaerolineae bacterium]